MDTTTLSSLVWMNSRGDMLKWFAYIIVGYYLFCLTSLAW